METYEEILSRMQEKFAELAGYPADEASDIGIRLRVLAGEIYSLTASMNWLEQQLFAQTAQGELLDLRAQERGIKRRAAQAASGVLLFSRAKPLWYRAVIDKGTVCAVPGGGWRTLRNHRRGDTGGRRHIGDRSSKGGETGKTRKCGGRRGHNIGYGSSWH